MLAEAKKEVSIKLGSQIRNPLFFLYPLHFLFPLFPEIWAAQVETTSGFASAEQPIQRPRPRCVLFSFSPSPFFFFFSPRSGFGEGGGGFVFSPAHNTDDAVRRLDIQ